MLLPSESIQGRIFTEGEATSRKKLLQLQKFKEGSNLIQLDVPWTTFMNIITSDLFIIEKFCKLS